MKLRRILKENWLGHVEVILNLIARARMELRSTGN